MTTHEASQLLELPPDATPAQIEARFRELRATYEGKAAAALTSGLREKYSAALAGFTLAYETLVLAQDRVTTSALSVPSSIATPSRLPSLPKLPPVPSSPAVAATPAAAKKSPLKLVLIAAVALLAAGGAGLWWQAQARAEEAALRQRESLARQQAETEQRLVAEAKAAEKQRLEAAEKIEREQRDQAFAALRTRLAEIHAAFDAATRAPQALEREMADLKSQRDELAASGKENASPEIRLLTAQIEAREHHATWLTETLSSHPAKAARRQAADAMLARSPTAASTAVDAYAQAARQLQVELTRARAEQLVIAHRVRITSEPSGVPFKLTDAFGREREARTPAELTEIPFGEATVIFARPGFPPIEQRGTAVRDSIAAISADLRGGSLALETSPFATDFVLEGQGRQEQGRTPAKFDELPPGDYRVNFARAGWPAQQATVTVVRGSHAQSAAAFAPPGTLNVTTQPAGAEVVQDGQVIGITPLTLADLPPGALKLELRRAEHRPATLEGVVEAGKELVLSATLRSAQLTPEEALDQFSHDAAGVWVGQGWGRPWKVKITAGSRRAMSRSVSMLGITDTADIEMVSYDPKTRVITCRFTNVLRMAPKLSFALHHGVLHGGMGVDQAGTNALRKADASAW